MKQLLFLMCFGMYIAYEMTYCYFIVFLRWTHMKQLLFSMCFGSYNAYEMTLLFSLCLYLQSMLEKEVFFYLFF